MNHNFSAPMQKMNFRFLSFLFVFCLFNTLSIQSHAQATAAASGIELKQGLHLVYDITQGEKTYQYIVDFNSVTEKGLVFNWKMTEPVNKSGTITITEKAFTNATDLDFYPATKKFDGEEISMIFGKTLFQKFAKYKEGDTISFGCNSCFRGVTVADVKANDYEAQNATGGLATLKTVKFSSIYHNGDFEVLNNEQFPLIIYFKWNMTIELKSFKYE